MKETLQKVRQHSDEVSEQFRTNIIHFALQPYFNAYNKKMRAFKLTYAELFYLSVWALDQIRDGCNCDLDLLSIILERPKEVYQDIIPKPSYTKSIETAFDMVENFVRDCIEHSKRPHIPTTSSVKLFRDWIRSEEDSRFINPKTLQWGKENFNQFWEKRLVPYLRDYVESDVSISAEVEKFIEQLDNPVLPLDPLPTTQPREEAPKPQATEDAPPQKTESAAEEEEESGTAQFTNRQLIVLFEELLNVTLGSSTVNKKAFAELLSRVSGRSEGSIRNKISPTGIDYQDHVTVRAVEEVARLLEKIAPDMAKKMRENL